MGKNQSIYVTQPFLPPLDEFIPYLESIWSNKILTNGGPFHQQLENALCEYLGVNHISLFSNGTLALITSLQELCVTGEVITTPYSFVATTHSLLWQDIKPVFIDIDPVTLNLNPDKIEGAITEHTTAILPVHCYGNPCNVDAIQRIADRYNLKVIYDGAHAFGVNYDMEKSLLQYGDLSIVSFHATKVFNTFEGGAIICHDLKTKQHIDYLKNFGFADEVTVMAPGINAKMSEINSAFGLLQLKHISTVIQDRRKIDNLYRELLTDVKGIRCLVQTAFSPNFSYFPILVESEYTMSRDKLYLKLKRLNIHARRYFYPLISDLPMYRDLPSAAHSNLPVASDASSRVLCLPIYPSLSVEEVRRICEAIRS